MTGRESTEPLDPAQIMERHERPWCIACTAESRCETYRLAEALAESQTEATYKGQLYAQAKRDRDAERARVQRARTWIMNAVDGAAVGFETKQQMLDYLAGDTEAPVLSEESDDCSVVDVDGEAVLVRGPLTLEVDQQMFAEVVRAAKRKVAEDRAAAENCHTPNAQEG